MEAVSNRKRDYCIFNTYDDKEKVTFAFKKGATKATVAFRADGGNLYRIKAKERQPFVNQFQSEKKIEGLLCRNGEFYLTCWDLETAIKMLNTTSWLGISLKTRLVEYHILTKYIVKNIHAVISLESIANELDRQGIIWQQIIRLKKSVSNESIPMILIKELGIVKRELIEMWSVTFTVEEYEEKPIVCKKCLKFGHLEKKCGGTYVCPRCGENHKVEKCASVEEKCVRCNCVKHDTFSKKCPKYIEEKEIINIKIKEQINYFEACAKYEENKKESLEQIKSGRRLLELETMRTRIRERMEELRRRLYQPDLLNFRSRG